jgi:hypothetical protein
MTIIGIVTNNFVTKDKLYKIFWEDEEEFYIIDDSKNPHIFTWKNYWKWFKPYYDGVDV